MADPGALRAVRGARRGSSLLSDIPPEVIAAEVEAHHAAHAGGAGGDAAISPGRAHSRHKSGRVGGLSAAAAAEAWRWIRHERLGWAAGKQINPADGGRFELHVDGTIETVAVPAADVGPEIHSLDDLDTVFEDMIKMADVCEGSILHNLRARFVGDDPGGIFTAIGQILVSINPYAWMDELYRCVHERTRQLTRACVPHAPLSRAT